jgi:uncharacterized protein
MELANKSFSLLIKPTSADCNLACPYCFYLKRSGLYPHRHCRMSTKTLEQLVSGYMKTQQSHYIFAWQGGEPTLMGIEFFKKAVEFQQKYWTPGSMISNGIIE